MKLKKKQTEKYLNKKSLRKGMFGMFRREKPKKVQVQFKKIPDEFFETDESETKMQSKFAINKDGKIEVKKNAATSQASQNSTTKKPIPPQFREFVEARQAQKKARSEELKTQELRRQTEDEKFDTQNEIPSEEVEEYPEDSYAYEDQPVDEEQHTQPTRNQIPTQTTPIPEVQNFYVDFYFDSEEPIRQICQSESEVQVLLTSFENQLQRKLLLFIPDEFAYIVPSKVKYIKAYPASR